MKIPESFYLSFRWKNSLWAFASGLLLGYVSLGMFSKRGEFVHGEFALAYLLIWGIGVAIVYQFAVQKYFYGKRRGEFEYAYLEDILKRRTKGILKSLPCDPADRDVLSIDSTALNPTILKIAEQEDDPERKFLLFLTLAVQCAKADEYAKIIEYSKEALASHPDDLVVNFMLAEAQEHQGEGGEAVKSYEAALRDPMAQSAPLKGLISAQIERVRTKGPRKGGKIQKGLRYMTY